MFRSVFIFSYLFTLQVLILVSSEFSLMRLVVTVIVRLLFLIGSKFLTYFVLRLFFVPDHLILGLKGISKVQYFSVIFYAVFCLMFIPDLSGKVLVCLCTVILALCAFFTLVYSCYFFSLYFNVVGFSKLYQVTLCLNYLKFDCCHVHCLVNFFMSIRSMQITVCSSLLSCYSILFVVIVFNSLTGVITFTMLLFIIFEI